MSSKNAKQKDKENENQWADCLKRLKSQKRKVKNTYNMYTHLHIE